MAPDKTLMKMFGFLRLVFCGIKVPKNIYGKQRLIAKVNERKTSGSSNDIHTHFFVTSKIALLFISDPVFLYERSRTDSAKVHHP